MTEREDATDRESELLDAARRGDPGAFRDIVLRYDDGLRALAFRLLGDRDRMDDVLQEAYVKAYRALPRFRQGSRLGTWLYRITYNACMDELRRARRGRWLRLEDVKVHDPSPDPGERATDRVAVERALSELPPTSKRSYSSSTGRASTTRRPPRSWACRKARWPHASTALARRCLDR